MKRVIAAVISVALLLVLSGCITPEPEFEAPANFYYLKREISYGVEDGVVFYEIQEASHIQNDLYTLLVQYLKGPSDPALYCAIPSDTAIIHVATVNGGINIVFSQEFAKLSGIDLTLACTCLSMTLLEYTQAEFVDIRVDGGLLEDSESIVMTWEDLLFIDSIPIPDETK